MNSIEELNEKVYLLNMQLSIAIQKLEQLESWMRHLSWIVHDMYSETQLIEDDQAEISRIEAMKRVLHYTKDDGSEDDATWADQAIPLQQQGS